MSNDSSRAAGLGPKPPWDHRTGEGQCSPGASSSWAAGSPPPVRGPVTAAPPRSPWRSPSSEPREYRARACGTRSRCRPPAERAAPRACHRPDRPGELWEWVEGAGVLHPTTRGRSGRGTCGGGISSVPDRPAAARGVARRPGNSMEHVAGPRRGGDAPGRGLPRGHVRRPPARGRLAGARHRQPGALAAAALPARTRRDPRKYRKPAGAGVPRSRPGPMRARCGGQSGLTALDIVRRCCAARTPSRALSCPVGGFAAPARLPAHPRCGSAGGTGHRRYSIHRCLAFRDEPCASAPGRRRCAASARCSAAGLPGKTASTLLRDAVFKPGHSCPSRKNRFLRRLRV